MAHLYIPKYFICEIKQCEGLRTDSYESGRHLPGRGVWHAVYKDYSNIFLHLVRATRKVVVVKHLEAIRPISAVSAITWDYIIITAQRGRASIIPLVRSSSSPLDAEEVGQLINFITLSLIF